MAKITNFLYLVSQSIAINIKGWLKIFISYLIYSQIWLNLPRDRGPLFLHLPMDDSKLSYIKDFLKQKFVPTIKKKNSE